jgi:small basic protein
MSGALREILTRPRSQHRVMAVAIGIGFVVIGIVFGIDKQFSNWPVVAFLAGFGSILAVCGFALPERYLAAFFSICIAINVVAAAYAVLFGNHV